MPRRSPARSASARSPPPGGSATAVTGAARPRSGAATRTSPPSHPPAARPRREHTVYECPGCGQRLLGEQRCPDCATFARRIGPGGPCPHCDEPVAITDLTQEVATMPAAR